ncbi:HNH endonuclease [Pontibacillus yanchengensis]|uniref:HNH endonuclease n=1 Tax=Pontibacillus yanchengensis TaxID=462910 RepID=UPI0013703517|nr:HNH endonuclease signature motif containing protein [Pontibacillus yanchengensis]
MKETFDAAVDHGCVYCGGELENDWSVEHVIPYSKGGTNEIHNVVIAHNACNFRKHNHAPADYCEAPGSLDQLAAYLYVMSDGKYEIDEAYALLKSGEANGE